MVYSVQQMALASRMAAAHGLEFVVVHDMRVPQQELLDLPRNATASGHLKFPPLEEADLATPPFFPLADRSQPLCAPTLLASDALRHFPTSFVIMARGIHPHPIVGAMPQAAWQTSLEQRLKP